MAANTVGSKKFLLQKSPTRINTRQMPWRYFLLLGFILAACAGGGQPEARPPALGEYAQPIDSLQPADIAQGQRLKVVATTSLVADLAGKAGGDAIELSALLPYGADPHGYSAAPQDLREVAEAQLVLSAGFDLEGSLLADLQQAVPSVPIISLSEGLEPIEFGPAENDTVSGPGRDEHDHGAADPHVWFDPIRMEQWAANAAEAFSRLDPAHEADYEANSSRVQAELEELDQWIRRQLQAVPAARRRLVTDHLALAYFAERYDFELIGALIPAYSSSAEVSARDLAELQHLAQQYQVAAIFVGSTANPALAQQISTDLGIPLVTLYTGSLTPPGGEADDYFGFMRYNVNAIVEALAP